MGNRLTKQEHDNQTIYSDPLISISVTYMFDDSILNADQIYEVDSSISLNEFIIYLKSIGSIPKFSDNKILITCIQIGQKQYHQEEQRNFKQLSVHKNTKVIIYLQTYEFYKHNLLFDKENFIDEFNEKQAARLTKMQQILQYCEILQIDKIDELVAIKELRNISCIQDHKCEQIGVSEKPIKLDSALSLECDTCDFIDDSNIQIENQFNNYQFSNKSQSLQVSNKPIKPDIAHYLERDNCDSIESIIQLESQSTNNQQQQTNQLLLQEKAKPVNLYAQKQKLLQEQQQKEQAEKQKLLQQQQKEAERQKLQQEQEYLKQKQLEAQNQIPINNVQIQTQTQLTKVEKELLEEINNTSSFIQQNIIEPTQSDNLLNEKQIKYIKQEEEILIDTFKCQTPVQKQADKTFQIIEQQKYHKIENAIKRKIKRNQQNNQIVNPLTVEKQKLVEDKNQEVLMFVLAEQMNQSGKNLYQSQQSEDINIFSLQASFSDQIEDTLCEKLTLQETPQLTFNQLKDDNDKEKKFYTTMREMLAKQYNVRPEDVNILSIECGSISVKYKITGNYSDADKQKEYTINEINKLFPGSNPVLVLHKYFDNIQLSPNDFDPRYNFEWGMDFKEYEMRGPPNDQMKYFFPRGWKGYALKVLGKYDNGNDDWLSMNSIPNQWHIMFHGTDNIGCKGIQQTGFKPGGGQAFAAHTDLRFNQLIGNGIYFSNLISVCEGYCRQPTVINGHQYKVVFMSRVRPTSLKQANANFFVVNKPEDIRPYRILLKKI